MMRMIYTLRAWWAAARAQMALSELQAMQADGIHSTSTLREYACQVDDLMAHSAAMRAQADSEIMGNEAGRVFADTNSAMSRPRIPREREPKPFHALLVALLLVMLAVFVANRLAS